MIDTLAALRAAMGDPADRHTVDLLALLAWELDNPEAAASMWSAIAPGMVERRDRMDGQGDGGIVCLTVPANRR